MIHTSSSETTQQEPWLARDRAYYVEHPRARMYVRDLLPGEASTLCGSELFLKLEGSGLYEALRKAMRSFSGGEASIRVAVLKIGRWKYLRCPVLDWRGRDKSMVWRLEADNNLREVPAESVIERCRQILAQDRWDEHKQ